MSIYDFIQGQGSLANVPSELFPFAVTKKLFEEYISIADMMKYASTNPSSPIVIEELKPEDGLQVRVANLKALDPNDVVVNIGQRRGGAQRLTYQTDEYNIDWITHRAETLYENLLRYGTPIHPSEKVISKLIESCKYKLTLDLFNASTKGAYPNLTTVNRNIPNTVPSYDRVVYPKALPHTRADWNGNSTLPTFFNGFSTSANTLYNNSGFSVDLLDQARVMAELGGSTNGVEEAIRPAYLKSRGGWPLDEYLCFIDPRCVQSIESDPRYIQGGYGRGVVIDEYTPNLISGAQYLGRFKGVHLIATKWIANNSFTSADGTKNVAWNLFVGASWLSLAWAASRDPEVYVEIDRPEKINQYFADEYRGQKLVKFDSNYGTSPGAVVGSATKVEKGLIHMFCSF